MHRQDFTDASFDASVTTFGVLGDDARDPRTNHAEDEIYYVNHTSSTHDGPFLSRRVDGVWQGPERLSVPRASMYAVAGLSTDGCRVYLVDTPPSGYAVSSLYVARRGGPPLLRHDAGP